jgi:hypothetical protein
VLDESGDVVLVFDDEDLMSGHAWEGRVPTGGIGHVSKMLIVS